MAGDVNDQIRVIAEYTDLAGHDEEIVSTPTAAVTGVVNNPPTGTVTIDNLAPEDGDILNASDTLMDADGLGAITFEWQSSFDAGATWSFLTTGPMYTVAGADVGNQIRVVAKYTDLAGNNEEVASSPTTAVTGVVNNPPTGAVTIDNLAPEDGDILNASDTLMDADGLGAITFEWQSSFDAGATWSFLTTGPMYTTVGADVGNQIRVVAKYTDLAGHNEEVASSPTTAVTGVVNNPPTGTVTIDNLAPEDGDILNASDTLMDTDGLGAITFEWQSSFDAGATWSFLTTGPMYTTVGADVGNQIRVVAKYTDLAGHNEEVASSPTTAVTGAVNNPPTGTVTIDNLAPEDGDILNASDTLMDTDGLGAITYEWQSSFDAGATWSFLTTGPMYTVAGADVGNQIRVVAKYTDLAGNNEEVASSPTAAVTGAVNNPPTGTVTIDNLAPEDGDILNASDTLMDADGLGAITFEWQSSFDAGATWSFLTTGPMYTTVGADVGNQIRVVAKYTDLAGHNEEVASAPTAAVTSGGSANNLPTGTVTIDNLAPSDGDTLTASNTLADLDGLGAITYEWEFSTDAGATWSFLAAGETYTVVAGDVGREIRVVAEYTDGAGNLEKVHSSPTAAAVADSPPPPPLGLGEYGIEVEFEQIEVMALDTGSGPIRLDSNVITQVVNGENGGQAINQSLVLIGDEGPGISLYGDFVENGSVFKEIDGSLVGLSVYTDNNISLLVADGVALEITYTDGSTAVYGRNASDGVVETGSLDFTNLRKPVVAESSHPELTTGTLSELLGDEGNVMDQFLAGLEQTTARVIASATEPAEHNDYLHMEVSRTLSNLGLDLPEAIHLDV